MRYSMNIKVRYSECGGDKKVPLHQILNYFQDAATFQSEELGYGVSYNMEQHRGWFLLAYDISIVRKPEMFEDLTLLTDPYKMKGYYGYRRFGIIDAAGDTIVTGDSIWILMDTDSLLPVKVPEDMSRAYVEESSNEKVVIKRKIRPGKEWEPADEFDISQVYLDTNHHVNNNYYALWAENLLDKEQAGRVRIDYRKAAILGDHVIIDRQELESGTVFRFENQNGDLLAYISITKKES